MAKVPYPERGQPLDVSYLYQLAEAINNISNELSPTVARFTTVDLNGSKQSVRTSDSRVVAAQKTVINTSGAEQQFSYTFSDFAYPPVVTVSPITLEDNNTAASRNVTAVITNVTTNRVDGVIRFGTTGVPSIGVNLIIVGIPV